MSACPLYDAHTRGDQPPYKQQLPVRHADRISHFDMDRDVWTAILLVFIRQWCQLDVYLWHSQEKNVTITLGYVGSELFCKGFNLSRACTRPSAAIVQSQVKLYGPIVEYFFQNQSDQRSMEVTNDATCQSTQCYIFYLQTLAYDRHR